MTGQLFTHYFLTDGIKTTPEWQASVDQPEAFAAFRNGVARHHSALSRSRNPSTRDMTLAYMNALAAGDTEAVVAV